MAMSFDPFSQLDRIAQSVFDTSRQPRIMPVDLFREGDRYILNADLPGADPASVDVDVDGHLLTIRAVRSAADRDGARWLAQERPYGAYMRQFTIGDDVDPDGITASYDNGVLSVMIPVAERAKPRKIAVESTRRESTGGESRRMESSRGETLRVEPSREGGGRAVSAG
ncbi:Hsp20/alpha crystallin family protein [Leifsonia sp. 2MCAF36]|uniref:Hsp20/alpha crystallin family protein n=1 Tax=Leifsonia sp. 2MCAF36 TaxID=3232988 RepID=UPI003F94CA6E